MLELIEVDEQFIEKMNVLRQPDKSKGLLEACSDSVILFSERMLGIKLYAWQVYFLSEIQKGMDGKDYNKEYVAMTSRQIGKSTAVAILSIWAAVFNKYPGTVHNNTIVGITSASDVQAKKLLYEMKKLINRGDKYIESTYTDKSSGKSLFGKSFFNDLLDVGEPNNTTTITFKAWDKKIHGDFLLKGSISGSVIKSYPPTSVVLGETFTIVIVDEAGKTDRIDDQFYYDYIYPTGNSTNAIRINLSTPWESNGFFYRLVNPDGIYTTTPAFVVAFTIEAIKIENKEYYDIVSKTISQMNSDGKHDEVQRAYYCRFVKGELAYFNPEKVNPVFTSEYSMLSEYKGLCDMGVDFGGQVKSRTAVTISELTDKGTVRRLFHKVYPVGKDITLIDDMTNLMTKFNVQRIIPDDCPAGQYMIKKMIEEKGWNVQPMNFRSEKVAKYGAFRNFLNKGKIVSYQDDELKTEMLAMEFNNGSKNSVIEHAPGYTDDLIDSFVMSSYFFVYEDKGVKMYDYFGDDKDE